MERYLEEFRDRLKPYEGSLFSVAAVREPYAKHFLGELAREGAVQRVDWGWYYFPSRRPPETPFAFLAQDRNFKIVTGQTAASFWNADFIHREGVTVTVEGRSYGRALESFFKKREWQVDVQVDAGARKIKHRTVEGLKIEEPGRAVVDCMKRWAFVDAVAVLAANPNLPYKRLAEENAWARIPHTDVRVGQALRYAAHQLFSEGPDVRIGNAVVREELDEAIEKVKEFE